MPKINVTVVYKKDIVLKSASEDHLEEVEYVLSKTTYNTKGEVISEIQYDPDGNITQETIHEYDDRGFLVKEILRDGDGFIADHKTYERNDQGKVNREFRHYMDESFDTVKYFYDDQGVLVKKETIDPDQDLESIEEFTHWNGLLTHYLLKDDQGVCLQRNVCSTTTKDKWWSCMTTMVPKTLPPGKLHPGILRAIKRKCLPTMKRINLSKK